jgi:ribosomal protein S2
MTTTHRKTGLPNSERKRSRAVGWGTWLKVNAHTLLLVGLLVGGWIANFATLSARTADVEKAESKLEQRFERDVVPRQEQEVRDRMLDQRLEQMQRSLDAIQQELRK